MNKLKWYYKGFFTLQQFLNLNKYYEIHYYYFINETYYYLGFINNIELNLIYTFFLEIEDQLKKEFDLNDSDFKKLKNFLLLLLDKKKYLKSELILSNNFKINSNFNKYYCCLDENDILNKNILIYMHLINYIFLVYLSNINWNLNSNNLKLKSQLHLVETLVLNNFFFNFLNLLLNLKFNNLYKLEHELLNIKKNYSLKNLIYFTYNLDLSDYWISKFLYNLYFLFNLINSYSLSTTLNIINVYESKEFSPIKVKDPIDKMNNYKRFFSDEILEILSYSYFYIIPIFILPFGNKIIHSIIDILDDSIKMQNVYLCFFLNIFNTKGHIFLEGFLFDKSIINEIYNKNYKFNGIYNNNLFKLILLVGFEEFKNLSYLINNINSNVINYYIIIHKLLIDGAITYDLLRNYFLNDDSYYYIIWLLNNESSVFEGFKLIINSNSVYLNLDSKLKKELVDFLNYYLNFFFFFLRNLIFNVLIEFLITINFDQSLLTKLNQNSLHMNNFNCKNYKKLNKFHEDLQAYFDKLDFDLELGSKKNK